MIKDLDLVALTRPMPDERLEAGAVGTVVMIHDGGYTLEFVAFDGETVAIVSVPSDAVRPLRPRELAYVHEPAE